MAIIASRYRGFRVTRGDATGEQLAILLDTDYRVLHVASAADEGTDWNVSNPTHPTLYIHSETTPATDYLSVAHDGTRASLTVAGGTMQLAGGDIEIPDGTGLLVGHTTQITMNALVPEFQVIGSTVGVDGAAAIGLYSSTAAEGPVLNFFRSKSATLGTNTIVASADSLGGIQWMGADGGTGFDPAAAIIAEVAATPGASTDMPGRILFQTSPDGSQTPATRMTVLSGATTVAQIQIGTAGTSTGSLILAGATSGTVTISPAAAAGSASYTLPAADAACCGFQLTCNGTGTMTWAAASLGAFKNDLGHICTNEALQTVINTPIHRFTYDPDLVPVGTWAPPGEFVGVFGEEAPWAMQGRRKMAFSPVNATGHLAAAIQALTRKVEALEAKLA